MSDNNRSAADISILTIRRQEAAELERLERARRELPALEQAEARRSHQAEASQTEQRLSDRLVALTDDYNQALATSNKEIRELIKYVNDLCERRASLDARGEQIRHLAEQVAQAKLIQNKGAAGAGLTGNYSQDRMALQATTEAVLAELDCRIGEIRIVRRTGATDDLVLTLLAELGCQISQPESKPPLRTFPIVDHSGGTVWR